MRQESQHLILLAKGEGLYHSAAKWKVAGVKVWKARATPDKTDRCPILKCRYCKSGSTDQF